MVGFSSQRKKHQLKTAGTGKRVIVVFGPPSVGTSTVLNCLQGASETSIIVVPYVGPDSILQAEEAQNHAEVVFLDVDGGVFTPDDVQRVVDNRVVYDGSGAIIHLNAPPEVILERAGERPGYISEEDLREWTRAVPTLEERIRQHTLNYFMIPNIDLEEAVQQVALRSGISR